MTSLGVDNIKTEKADALRRYNRKRILISFLRVSGAVLFLVCLLSFTKIQVLNSNNFSASNDQFRAFILVNAIINILYQLSAATKRIEAQGAAAPPRDMYVEHVSLSSASSSPRRRTTISDEEDSEQLAVVSRAAREEDSSDDKMLVAYRNVVDDDDDVLAAENPVRDLMMMESCNDEAAEEEKRYKRTRSEKLELVIKEEEERSRRREVAALRRCATERRRKGVASAEDGEYSPESKSVEEMDSQEFQRMIENYIASRRKSWKAENTAILNQEQQLAIAY